MLYYCQSEMLLKSVPFQKPSGNVSIWGKRSSGIIICLGAAEAWWPGYKKLTRPVSTKGRYWRGEGLTEIISHRAQSVPPATTAITFQTDTLRSQLLVTDPLTWQIISSKQPYFKLFAVS